MVMINKIVRTLLIAVVVTIRTAGLFSPFVAAQAVVDPGYLEELYIQTDRDIYFTGEEVLVKVSKFNGLSGTPGDFSKVGYIDLYNESGYQMAHKKVDLENFSGATGFRIPDSLSSGNYFVRAYTSWMKNFPLDGFAHRIITVINPFEDIAALQVKSDGADSGTLATVSVVRTDEDITGRSGNSKTASGNSIRILDDHPGTRERVEIRIEGADAMDPRFSVTVVKSVLLNEICNDEKPVYEAGPSVFDLSDARYIPELKGNILKGVIRDKDSNEPLPNTNIILSFIGKNARCQFTRSDYEGRFNVLISDKGVLNVVIAPVSEFITDYYVELEDPYELSVPGNPVSPVYMDTTRLRELNEAIIGMQIRNIYDPYLGPDPVAPVQHVVNNFYGEPDNVVFLSDYIELNDLTEVVKEIIPGVWTQKRNRQINLRLLNKYPTGDFYKSPLVLFDGVPVRDIEEILEVPASEIERIDIFNTRYFVSDITIEGIIHFISQKGDMSMIDYDKSIFRQVYNSVDNSWKELYYPDYSTTERRNSRIPDYRNTLYWDPFVGVNSDGDAVVDFYTSDEEGDYTVIVEGFTKDGGHFRSSSGFTVTRR